MTAEPLPAPPTQPQPVLAPAARRPSRPRRPALAPGVVVLRRSPTEVQVGPRGGPSFVLAEVDAHDTATQLSRLDGRASREVLPTRVTAMVDLLDDAGLVVEAAAPPLAVRLGPGARTARRVDVVGGGRLGIAVAALLAAEGVGVVDVTSIGPDSVRAVRSDDVAPWGPSATDVGGPWAVAAGSAVRRARVVPPPAAAPDRPDLVVLCGSSATLAVTDALLADDRAHLLVSAAGGAARVGPLVVPGTGPCVRCLELHRTDRDPAWPLLHAQLVGHPAPDAPAGPALTTMAAALAAQHVLALLDRRPDAPELPGTGAAWDCRSDELVWRRRSWGRHPACGCGWRATESA